ncbi:DsbA family protein, partial [Candidatus Micrarchaeota archaeon]|nr:DsbA family protein [Candidatus Micrarchaeota archaeon]
QADLEAGKSYGITETPYFILSTRNGKNVVTLKGALPYGTFKATIDELLK